MGIQKLLEEPITFLGATVISVNTNVGFGGSESTMNLELVEDCDKGQVFLPKVDDNYSVGRPVTIEIGDFFFGGFLTNWKESLGSNGYTISCTVTDPRSILDNVTVVTDSYVGDPILSSNYVNAYAYWEGDIFKTNSCDGFGTGQVAERGMPYLKVMEALQNIDPVAMTSTAFPYRINWSTFIGSPSFSTLPTTINGAPVLIPDYTFDNSFIPDYFRVTGPSTTVLQLLQSVCDLLGLEFYCYLTNNWLINIGYVDLKVPNNTSFEWIKTQFGGKATDISYGQEIRNEKTKNLVIGENQHYMSITKEFDHFFGEDKYGALRFPVVPFTRNACGFWINKRIDELRMQMNLQFPSSGPYWISELDIRSAMAGFNEWKDRVLNPNVLFNDNPRTLNYQIQALFGDDGQIPGFVGTTVDIFNSAAAANNAAADNMGRIGTDAAHAVSQKGVRIAANILDRDLNAVHSWVKGLGDTYYGKQFITNLNQKICYNYSIENDPLSQRVFTDTPTTAGAWVDYGVPVLGLNSPDLDGFRGEDNRIQAFLRFDITDPNSNIIDPTEEENKQGLGQVENPEEVVTDLAPVLGNVATPNTSPDDYARIELNE
jgi:hypothetical protein